MEQKNRGTHRSQRLVQVATNRIEQLVMRLFKRKTEAELNIAAAMLRYPQFSQRAVDRTGLRAEYFDHEDLRMIFQGVLFHITENSTVDSISDHPFHPLRVAASRLLGSRCPQV